MQVIFVHREDPDSRHKTADAIMHCANAPGLRPLLIFPEGATTNGTCLISFKPGAFRPGVPVQPVVVQYPHRHFNPSARGKPGKNPLLLMLQFANRMEVTLLDVYTPSREERTQPMRYAQGVRDVLRAAMAVPVTRHSYDDVFLAALAEKSGIQQTFEVEVVERLTGFGLKELQALMKQFRMHATHKEGPHGSPVLEFDDFCRALAYTEEDRHKVHLCILFGCASLFRLMVGGIVNAGPQESPGPPPAANCQPLASNPSCRRFMVNRRPVECRGYLSQAEDCLFLGVKYQNSKIFFLSYFRCGKGVWWGLNSVQPMWMTNTKTTTHARFNTPLALKSGRLFA